MNNLTREVDLANFAEFNSINKCQKEGLPLTSNRERKINNGPVSRTDLVMSTFRDPRCLYVNIVVFCVSLALFLSVFFGFVPYTVQYNYMQQELSATKGTMERFTGVHNQLQSVAHELDGHLSQCTKDLDHHKVLLNKTLVELEASKSSKLFMDERMTQLKDQLANLTTNLGLKDKNIALLEHTLNEKASQPACAAEPVEPAPWFWLFAQNDASNSCPNIAIFLPTLYICSLGFF